MSCLQHLHYSLLLLRLQHGLNQNGLQLHQLIFLLLQFCQYPHPFLLWHPKNMFIVQVKVNSLRLLFKALSEPSNEMIKKNSFLVSFTINFLWRHNLIFFFFFFHVLKAQNKTQNSFMCSNETKREWKFTKEKIIFFRPYFFLIQIKFVFFLFT